MGFNFHGLSHPRPLCWACQLMLVILGELMWMPVCWDWTNTHPDGALRGPQRTESRHDSGRAEAAYGSLIKIQLQRNYSSIQFYIGCYMVRITKASEPHPVLHWTTWLTSVTFVLSSPLGESRCSGVSCFGRDFWLVVEEQRKMLTLACKKMHHSSNMGNLDQSGRGWKQSSQNERT